MDLLRRVIALTLIIGFLSVILFLFAIPFRFALLNPTSDNSVEKFFNGTCAITVFLLALEIIFIVKGFRDRTNPIILIITLLIATFQVCILVYIIGGLVFNVEFIVNVVSYILSLF